MKKNIEQNNIDKQVYQAPQMEVVEIATQGILCQSLNAEAEYDPESYEPI
ncbi:MAG: hypothetical protein J6O54_07905 [Prevotella sp.]|nr:hypothetical protein [Prevotella sp.]